MRLSTALLAPALAAGALALPSAAAASSGEAAPTASASARCAGVDLGFTTAKVSTRRLSCAKGRALVDRWRRSLPDNQPAPRVKRISGYRCTFSGTDAALKLRCVRGSRVAVARWGG